MAFVAIGVISILGPVHAHEIRPAIADVTLTEDRIEMELRLTAELYLAGINADGLTDTDEVPEAEFYDQLRATPAPEIAERFADIWPRLRSSLTVNAGGQIIEMDLKSAETLEEPDRDLPRDTRLTLSAELPNDGSDVKIGWRPEFGPLIVRQAEGGDDAYAGYLEKGALSEPLPRVGSATEGGWAVFLRYIVVGFDHIIPKGLDHILFVLGLFFLSLKIRPLVTQVTVFTIAHTITLALASLGFVTVSPAIVEPLIAASIVYVAVENLMTSEIKWWRPLVIFGFGLLHGLGFASVLQEFGLAPGRFIAGLIGFNIGVEIGQLAVIAIAFLAVGLWFGKKAWYRTRIAMPASVVIALIGAWWAFERVFL